MKSPDSIYQDAVDSEIDRLARLSPCELMRIEPLSWKLDTECGPVELHCVISDQSDVRHIVVMSERPLMLGMARRRFVAAVEVKLSAERMSNACVSDLYD
ncbi:hypothetical protein C2862_03625 [Massilia sp. Mn16-1_5]|nr:hypothetical protein C2862_03625 [Massilia sp. Mn16-1_5]